MDLREGKGAVIGEARKEWGSSVVLVMLLFLDQDDSYTSVHFLIIR